MPRYVATINVPGYLPMDDEPPVFDTAREAWQYLADERERGEDETEGEEYSQTFFTLRALAHDGPAEGDEPGTVYGYTPGYEGEHDLGLVYSVSIAED